MTSILSSFGRIRTYAAAHKVMSTIVAVAVVGGGYWAYKATHPATTQTLYVLSDVATGTVIASVSASGQVSASNSIDVKPQVSGTITHVYVNAGDQVAAGQALAFIDDTTAQQTLAQAKSQYAADQLQYQKDTAQAPITYQNDVQALATAKDDLQTEYNTTYDDLTGTYLDLPAVMSGAQNTLYGYDFDSRKLQYNVDVLFNLFTSQQDTTNVQTFRDSSENDYTTAKSQYDDAVNAYKLTTRTSDNATLDSMLSQSITMLTAVAQALQTELNYYGAVSDAVTTYGLHLPSGFSSVQSSTRSYLSTANADLSKLLADKKALDADKQSITAAEQAVTLDQVGNPAGDNPISLQISKNNLEKEAQSIANQEADLAKYTVRAPFAGMVSVVNVKPGDSASGAVATVITHTKVATLSLNEVDAAKIQLGDKATLTFDAIDGLSLNGAVVEMDPIGTVSQGVVSYSIQVSFDTQDTRVKPGMTVNADIQTEVAQNVLVVPTSAIHTQNGSSYVQVFDPPIAGSGGTSGVASDVAPKDVPVEIGISDDTNTEIRSGLTSGQQIVVRTTSGTVSAAASATSRSNFGGPGLRGL